MIKSSIKTETGKNSIRYDLNIYKQTNPIIILQDFSREAKLFWLTVGNPTVENGQRPSQLIFSSGVYIVTITNTIFHFNLFYGHIKPKLVKLFFYDIILFLLNRKITILK